MSKKAPPDFPPNGELSSFDKLKVKLGEKAKAVFSGKGPKAAGSSYNTILLDEIEAKIAAKLEKEAEDREKIGSLSLSETAVRIAGLLQKADQEGRVTDVIKEQIAALEENFQKLQGRTPPMIVGLDPGAPDSTGVAAWAQGLPNDKNWKHQFLGDPMRDDHMDDKRAKDIIEGVHQVMVNGANPAVSDYLTRPGTGGPTLRHLSELTEEDVRELTRHSKARLVLFSNTQAAVTNFLQQHDVRDRSKHVIMDPEDNRGFDFRGVEFGFTNNWELNWKGTEILNHVLTRARNQKEVEDLGPSSNPVRPKVFVKPQNGQPRPFEFFDKVLRLGNLIWLYHSFSDHLSPGTVVKVEVRWVGAKEEYFCISKHDGGNHAVLQIMAMTREENFRRARVKGLLVPPKKITDPLMPAGEDPDDVDLDTDLTQ